jgi:hypothetical protein
MGATSAKNRAGSGMTNPTTSPINAIRRRDGRRVGRVGFMPETVARATRVLFRA